MQTEAAKERPTAEVLRSLLAPRSVAVVGASESAFTFSGAPVHNLLTHGFTGAIYPVNPRREMVGDLRCFASVADIPEAVDTAVITVPAPAVLDVLEECERIGVRTATVVSAGFGEDGAGDAGQANARRLEEFLEASRMRILGPNTAGLMNLLDDYVPRAAANHLPSDLMRPGSVALVTQSGACSNIIFNRSQASGVGVGLMAATGGECDITVWDLVEHTLVDDRIAVVTVVIEALGDPDRMRTVAAQARHRRKPIVLLKLGSSELGSEVVLTHSGSIAGDAAVARAAFDQWGIVLVRDFDALWQTARLFEAWGTPAGPSGNLGVFAFSGGEAALIADQASESELALPPITSAFDTNIRSELAFAKAANPFDATGELVGRPEKLLPVLTSFLDDNEFSEVLIATPVYRAEAAERVLPQLTSLFAARGSNPRVVFSMWPAGELTERQTELLTATGQPVLPDSTRAVAAVDLYATYLRRLDAGSGGAPRPRDVADVAAPPADGTYSEIRTTLQQVGLPFAAGGVAQDVEEAAELASEIGYPVVLKGDVVSTVHKAQAGLVAIGLGDEEAVRRRFSEIQINAKKYGATAVAVEAMTPGSLQCFIGARRDPDFGPTMIFGLGGSAAEFLEDTALLVLEEGSDDFEGLLTRTRVGTFLARDFPAVAANLAAAIGSLASWFECHVELSGVDLNPVMVDTTTATVTCVDGRIDRAED